MKPDTVIPNKFFQYSFNKSDAYATKKCNNFD